ncbi:hypothetical protein CHS0354_033494, partial [Potamilus streckersoni]
MVSQPTSHSVVKHSTSQSNSPLPPAKQSNSTSQSPTSLSERKYNILQTTRA